MPEIDSRAQVKNQNFDYSLIKQIYAPIGKSFIFLPPSVLALSPECLECWW